MKILITENQLKKIIRASQAYNALDSMLTIKNDLRDVAFISFIGAGKENREKMNQILNDNKDLLLLKVEGATNYIIFKEPAIEKAMELKNLAEKYGGYLSGHATEEDSRRIGELLSYHPDDIEDYIQRNRRLYRGGI